MLNKGAVALESWLLFANSKLHIGFLFMAMDCYFDLLYRGNMINFEGEVR